MYTIINNTIISWNLRVLVVGCTAFVQCYMRPVNIVHVLNLKDQPGPNKMIGVIKTKTF